MADSRTPPLALSSATLGTSAAASSRYGGPDRVSMALSARAQRRHGGRKRGRHTPSGVIRTAYLGNDICPIPERLFVRMPYEIEYNISNPAPGAPSFGVTKLNSIFNSAPPNVKNAAWFDNIGALYMFWRCHGSEWDTDYVGNINSVDQYCAVWPSAVTSTASAFVPQTASAMRAFPNARWRCIQTQAGLGPGSKVNLKYYCNVADTFGLDANGSVFGEGSFPSAPGGATDIVAQQTYYWITGYFTSDAAMPPSTGINVDVICRVTYYVECFGMTKPDNLTLSDLELMNIDSKGALTLAPPEDQPREVEFVAQPPILSDMSDSTYDFIEKLKAKLR